MVDNHENSSDFNIKKKVDESWKDNVKKERETAEPAVKASANLRSDGEESLSEFEPSFSSLVTTLGMQAFAALGESPGPASSEQSLKADLVQAKSLIDILQILSEKTKGNLTEAEAAMLQEILYGLKMKFVEKSGKP